MCNMPQVIENQSTWLNIPCVQGGIAKQPGQRKTHGQLAGVPNTSAREEYSTTKKRRSIRKCHTAINSLQDIRGGSIP